MRALLRLIWRGIVVLALWRSGWLKRRRDRRATRRLAAEVDPSERKVGAGRTATRLTVGLFWAAAICGVAFTVLYIEDPQTQLLGLAGGLGLFSMAAAMMLAGAAVVPQETQVEERPELDEPSVVNEVVERALGGLDGITRRRLIGSAAAATATGMAAAVTIPLVEIGPRVDKLFEEQSWHHGKRLVDIDHKPIPAEAIIEGSFYAAFPEGGNFEQLSASINVVRVNPAELKLPKGRESWAPEGLLAYSRICTHAGCAIALYRWPLHRSTSPAGPALVCPCHYSTFDVLDGAQVVWGPAGRPLPQLPLMIDGEGNLRAAGRLSGPVGPSWWGDKE